MLPTSTVCRTTSSLEQGKSIKHCRRLLKRTLTYLIFICSVKQLFETADRMYINPPHRFTVYAMGIGLGYILRMFGDTKLTSSQIKVGWYLSTLSLMLAFFGPAPMGDIDYKFDATQAAHYAAFAPILWNIFFGWIIVVSQLGYKSRLRSKYSVFKNSEKYFSSEIFPKVPQKILIDCYKILGN